MTLWLLLAISIVSGDKICAPDDPLSCRQAVKTGEVVPFDGQLLSPRKAAKLAVQAGQCQTRVDEAIKFTKKELGIDLELEKQLRLNDQDHAEQAEKILTEELQRAHEAADTGVANSPVLWFGVGVLATTVIIIATIGLIDATRPQVVTISN